MSEFVWAAFVELYPSIRLLVRLLTSPNLIVTYDFLPFNVQGKFVIKFSTFNGGVFGWGSRDKDDTSRRSSEK